MISDEPDEDADLLDDDELVQALTGTTAPAAAGGAAPAHEDWPPRSRHEEEVIVDADILVWFKANHADWHQRIRGVLRAWMVARPDAAVLPGAPQAPPDAPL